MSTTTRRLIATLLGLTMFGATSGALAQAPPVPSAAGAIGRTPPRLSLMDGEVSFWRPGAPGWAPAQINIPLAPGDELYTGDQGNLELQVGTRAFVRAWGNTQLGLANQEPDFLQFKVTGGHASLDLRSLDAGRTVELDTPHATFTVESPGYYRVDVAQDRTSFITRRGGRATMTPPGGQPLAITPSEEVVVEGTPAPAVQSFVAPELDAWDRWNYARTDQLLDAVSARYVPVSVYGAGDLDHYGTWREVPTYGPVWVPEGVPAGWAPYSAGKWIWDPFYGWTWLDTAPWGWAPFHYGRWVVVGGLWAWAPGPVLVRTVYAPALVVFFGAPGIRVSVGAPVVSWVALGWGEPLVPWWGRPGFVGRPSWDGWGGPRVVNNVVVNRTTVVNVTNITVYKNVRVQNAVVAVPQESFGRRPIHEARIAQPDVRRMEPIRGPLRIKPEASSFVAAGGGAARPPDALLSRPVVATRAPVNRPSAPPGQARPAAPVVTGPAPRIVAAPAPTQAAPVPARPRFGRSELERPRPPLPPRFETAPGREAAPAAPREDVRRPGVMPPGTQERARVTEPARVPEPAPAAPAPRQEPHVPSAAPPKPALPGEPANRLFQGRAQVEPRRPEPAAPRAEPQAPKPAPSAPGPARPAPAPGGEHDRR